MSDKTINIPVTQAYMMAAEEVMLNLPFENKEFNPCDKDECVEALRGLVEKGWLKEDWIVSVASANYSNAHTAIELDSNWRWSYLGGLNKSTHSREDFMELIRETREKVEGGDFQVFDKRNKKTKWGKDYFKKKGGR